MKFNVNDLDIILIFKSFKNFLITIHLLFSLFLYPDKNLKFFLKFNKYFLIF